MALRLCSHNRTGRRDHRDRLLDITACDNYDAPEMVLPTYVGPSFVEETLTFTRKVHFADDRVQDMSDWPSGGKPPVKRKWAVKAKELDRAGNVCGPTKRFTVSEHFPRSDCYDDANDFAPQSPPFSRNRGCMRRSRRQSRLAGSWEDANAAGDYAAVPWETYDSQETGDCRWSEQFRSRQAHPRSRSNISPLQNYRDLDLDERPGELCNSLRNQANRPYTTRTGDDQGCTRPWSCNLL